MKANIWLGKPLALNKIEGEHKGMDPRLSIKVSFTLLYNYWTQTFCYKACLCKTWSTTPNKRAFFIVEVIDGFMDVALKGKKLVPIWC